MSEHSINSPPGGSVLDAGAFWDFAVHLYSLPGVAPGCLAAQDQSGARVNLLLLTAWLARHGLCPDDPAPVRATAQDWHRRAVIPLRSLRRSLKGEAETDPAVAALRRAVQDLELSAERIEQERLLADLGPLHPAPPADILALLLPLWAGGVAEPLRQELTRAFLQAVTIPK